MRTKGRKRSCIEKSLIEKSLIVLILALIMLIMPVGLNGKAAEAGEQAEEAVVEQTDEVVGEQAEEAAAEQVSEETMDQADDESSDQDERETPDQGGVETADDFVEILVEGSLEDFDRQAILDRINEIREEACREGVQSPIDGEPLRPGDYVPLEWSYELEKIAILRAAESTILQDHVRPDGSDCFTAAPEGVPYTMETLAWGFGSAAAAVEGWYSEKTAYVEGDGTPAGHYIALINPENRLVGIADLRAEWQRDACAGAFASHGETGTANDGAMETTWSIPLLNSYLPIVIDRAVLVTARRIANAVQLTRQ